MDWKDWTLVGMMAGCVCVIVYCVYMIVVSIP
jgi:hypothetical protein